ncbi:MULTISPECIES: sulfite exporter TauE/SafE family protein [Nocardioides]|uniref:Probable membrane transporter protein n=1 Tax=Nocardioides vastitatis TaxID=2568655 RepID=A0ABW0ZFV7_9ACTN|nr:sulfite exporter TauE/SafE family protein [Nocardioides sp.]THI91118.1 sulfite exporter TauE/SafE family protein [Nocardioides sp.]
MTAVELGALLFAGVWAGVINTIVGSGTLVTFPTMLALGIPPVTANMSNCIGLVPGSVAGAFGYRRELVGQRTRILRLTSAVLLGGVVGAVLLLVLPPRAFEAIVPALILFGVALVALQPWLARRVRERAEAGETNAPDAEWVWPAMFMTGAYGGYFGAAFGVISMGVLGAGVHDAMQRLNAVKNILAASANAVASVVFIVVAQFDLVDGVDIAWLATAVLAVGAVGGGLLGASVGRRLSPLVLRGVIVTVGFVAAAVIVAG